MEFVKLMVKERPETGTRKMRGLRSQGLIPAVLYGQGKRNLSLTIGEKDLERFTRSGSRLVELQLGEQARLAIVREVQHDAVSDAVLHVDFVRVDKDHEIEDRVPVVYKGRAKGATTGGIFQAVINDVRVRCRPLDLPREIVIDVTPLELNQALYAKDLQMPEGVRLVDNPEELIAHVVTPKLEAEPVAAAAEGAAAEPAEPELIRKAPVAEEGEEAAAPAKGEKKEEKKEPKAGKK